MVEQRQIDHLLQETSEIEPPAWLVENANIQDYESEYKRSTEDPEGFWSEVASELDWYKPWTRVFRMGLPQLQVVPGRRMQHNLQLPGPASERRPQE